MTESLEVVLEDAVAGTLERLPGARLRFQYSAAYMDREEATPLSLSMPRQIRSHLDPVITPWLWGLLPDNDRVLARWSRDFHVSASSPFALLGTPVGHDCAGAVRFARPNELAEALHRDGTVHWLSEEEVGQRLRELRGDTTSWLGQEFTGQFSLAGAEAKTALLQKDGRWGVPSGAIATSHILKPAVAGLDDHDLNEHLCLDAARRAGLVVARTRVQRFGDESAVVVERYDRRELDGQLIRIHQEDLAQALGVHPSRKYQNEGGPSSRDIVDLFRTSMSPRVAEDAIWRFVDALVWNWLIAGTDAHAKNYSVLLSGGQARLAPLYDIASALPYDTSHGHRLRLAMKLGGSYRISPYKDPWPKVADELALDRDRLAGRVATLIDRAPSAFADAARAEGVVGLNRELPDRLASLVADRVEQCAELAASTTGAS